MSRWAVEDAAKHVSKEFDQVEGQELRFRQENGGLQSDKEKTCYPGDSLTPRALLEELILTRQGML